MARKAFPDELEELEQAAAVEEAAEEREPRAVRRSPKPKTAAAAEPRKRRQINLVYWTVPFVALLAAVMAFFAFHRLEAYLINETKFRLGAADSGIESDHFKVVGVKRAGREAVQRIFDQDFGRSIYLFPIAERRRNLLALDWVKDAVVQRRWPNRVFVEIRERQPIAFVQFDRAGSSPYFRLVDEEGVLLPVPAGERFDLVVLTGLKPTDIEPERAVRVRRAAALLRDIGKLASRISEIDVRDAGNLRASMKLHDVVVQVQLGNQNFQPRLENFFAHFDKVHLQRPDAFGFDLRIDGKIIAIGDPARAARALAGQAEREASRE